MNTQMEAIEQRATAESHEIEALVKVHLSMILALREPAWSAAYLGLYRAAEKWVRCEVVKDGEFESYAHARIMLALKRERFSDRGLRRLVRDGAPRWVIPERSASQFTSSTSGEEIPIDALGSPHRSGEHAGLRYSVVVREVIRREELRMRRAERVLNRTIHDDKQRSAAMLAARGLSEDAAAAAEGVNPAAFRIRSKFAMRQLSGAVAELTAA